MILGVGNGNSVEHVLANPVANFYTKLPSKNGQYCMKLD